MTLQDRINKLINEESLKQNLPFEKVSHFAERGCYIAFRKTLIELITLYKFQDDEEEKMRDVIVVCISGGALEVSAMKECASNKSQNIN